MSSVGSLVGSLLQKIGDIPNIILRLGTNYKTKSLIDVTQVARVEPLTVISRDCLNLEYMSDVMQSALSIFAGYYLQAVALSARVDNVKVVRVLDRLNPDRAFNDLMLVNESYVEHVNLAVESYKFRLPTTLNKRALESEVDRLKSIVRPATEFLNKTTVYNPDDVDALQTDKNGASAKDIKNLTEAVNLSVGKLINVDININDNKVVVPISMRLSAAPLPNDTIMHILAMKKDDNTLTERFHAWRAGRIGLIKDLIFCQDLIDEHKRALMEDEAGVYSEIVKRVNNAKKFGILSANPSLVSASNIFIISEAVAAELEQKIGGKLSNARVRQRVFENTYAMLLIVVDREWERVTFYHRGIAMATEVSIKDIKSSNKDKGPDILDVLKSFSGGVAPVF